MLKTPGLLAAQQICPTFRRRLDKVVVQGPVPPVELGHQPRPGLTQLYGKLPMDIKLILGEEFSAQKWDEIKNVGVVPAYLAVKRRKKS